MGEEVAAEYCQISVHGRYTQAKNISLGKKLEIMDGELAAIHEALQDLHDQGLQVSDVRYYSASSPGPIRSQCAYAGAPPCGKTTT
jgi:hypothetical protein